MPRPGQQSAEGFNLMLYRNEETGREEWLWNSRDGVTPFMIPDAEDGGDMKHDDWFRDTFSPFYIPPVGTRIFVDMTETRARALAARNAQHWWNEKSEDEDGVMRAGLGVRERYESVEAMAASLWPSYMGPDGGKSESAPDILVVNSAMQKEFRDRRPVRTTMGSGRFA